MKRLSEIMLEPQTRVHVLKDCVVILEEEVARKSGLTGIMVRKGYDVLKKVKPTMVNDAMDSLLDEFVLKLEPVHEEYEATRATQSLDNFLSRNSERVANKLLEVTDSRARVAKNMVIKGAYDMLRPVAVKQIQEGMPAVGRLLKKYVPEVRQ